MGLTTALLCSALGPAQEGENVAGCLSGPLAMISGASAAPDLLSGLTADSARTPESSPRPARRSVVADGLVHRHSKIVQK